uniref:DNA sliding clamp PCNA n=1 Tax=Setaria digitata TaxID=48799 RepID=A0A915PHM1_9BILA
MENTARTRSSSKLHKAKDGVNVSRKTSNVNVSTSNENNFFFEEEFEDASGSGKKMKNRKGDTGQRRKVGGESKTVKNSNNIMPAKKAVKRRGDSLSDDKLEKRKQPKLRQPSDCAGTSKSRDNAKAVRKQKKRNPKVSISSDDTVESDASEDEWEEVDFDEQTSYEVDHDGTVEVTIKAEKPVETEESKWAKFIRQQVNRKIRERQINCHKMHLLCYITHLRMWTRALVRDEMLKSLCLSLIPEGYVTAAKHEFEVAIAERFLKWFRSTFQLTSKNYISENGSCDSQIKRLEDLVAERCYEDDKDVASVSFSTMNMLQSEHTEVFVKENINNDDNAVIWEQKLYEVAKKIRVKTDDYIHQSNAEGYHQMKTDTKKAKGNNRNNVTKTSSTTEKKMNLGRNYWVEYWEHSSARWIYLGMRDVTARYASKFLSAEIRRLRVDSSWWTDTLKIYRSKDRKLERIEDVTMHNDLLSKPRPATVAEYKNHPLYVLKKDILKYEAIYPENQAPIGQIRGIDIYPRSSVFHLDGALNWMKKARMVKEGEKPYKIVKGRVNRRAVSEVGESRSLELFGYWQTEPYVPPKVVDGRIPRNEFGNLYVYKKSMIPEGCVHLRLNGIFAIARQLDIDCVPAVVGWEFHKGGNHPILEGCVILKKHEEILREAWKEFYEKKQIAVEKRRKERALKNWRRLIKGMLTMKKVRAKFLVADRRNMQIDEKLEDGDNETPIADDIASSWPQTIFTLPDADNSSYDMVGRWGRLTPKQAVAKIFVAIVGLAIGAYGVATIYKPLQWYILTRMDSYCSHTLTVLLDWALKTNWICERLNYCDIIKRNMTNASDKLPTNKTNKILTANDNDGGYHDQLSTDSLFKRTFKFYKRHDVVPDFSKVLDLKCSSSVHGITCSKFEPTVIPSDVVLERLGLRPVSEWTASTITHRPGMVMLNDIFKPISHLQWIERSLFVYAEPPGVTNIGLHIPNVRNIFKEHRKQLRWSTLGLHYDWTRKIYPTEGESLPQELVSLSDLFAQALGLGPMFADAAIINFYSRKSTLAPHVDRSERELSLPLISVSFGQTAIYLAGGTDLDDPIDAFYIRSGDVLIIYGSQRLIYHAVPRILQNYHFNDCDKPDEVVKYANENRINITIRQIWALLEWRQVSSSMEYGMMIASEVRRVNHYTLKRMFEAKLGSASTLKRIVDAIKDLVTDAPFDCSETAMCLQAMDSSHVALVSLKMDVAMFESYRCDRTINLGLSLAGMARALKCANNEDTCLIRYEENDDSVLFLFEDTKRDKSQEVVVKMMDIDSEHLGIPEQDYSAVVCMPSAEFQKTCRDLAMFSDSLMITVTKAGIVFTGKGDTGSSTVTYAPSKSADDDDQQAVSVDVKEPVTVNFSIKYMNHFTKATGLSDRVRLSLCNSVPVVVEYGLSENGHLRFYLAPKIDDEDADMK